MSEMIFERTSAKRLFGCLMILFVIVFLSLSAAAYAAEITYKGDGKGLQNTPLRLYSYEQISLFPGTEKNPLSSDNKVIINYAPTTPGVKHPGFVSGGISEWDNVVNNKVILLNGKASKHIFAGRSINGDSNGNEVTISGGSADWSVFGGDSRKGESLDNSVTMSGGIVHGLILGGVSENGAAEGNKVIMSGGSVGWGVSGARSGSGDVTGNVVTISGGSVSRSVDGGYCISGRGCAVRNTVNISGGSVGGDVFGGASCNGSAMNNTVNISSGSFGSDNPRDSAVSNTVNISGGVVGEVVGEEIFSDGKGNAISNTVNISGKPNLAAANILGGYKKVVSGDVFTGNTFNLKSSGISAKSIGNFEFYNFYLPENLAAGGVMLSVTETVNLQRTTVKVYPQGVGKLSKGDKISLIKSTKGVSGAPKNKSCQVKQRGLLYEFSIYIDGNNLWARVTKISKTAK